MKLLTVIGIFSILISAHAAQNTVATKASEGQVLELAITENGYEPSSFSVQPNVSTKINVTRKTDATCAKQLQIPTKEIKVDLPLNKTVTVELGKLKKGDIKFGCGMGMMMGGIMHVL